MDTDKVITNTNTPLSGAKKILIIEDDKFYGNIFPIKFKQAGFETQLADDAIKGIALARSMKPDLILLDLIMPGKDGFETLTELKADPLLKGIPIIVMSNLGQGSDIEKAKSLGAIDYMVKANISLQEAVDKVKSLLS